MGGDRNEQSMKDVTTAHTRGALDGWCTIVQEHKKQERAWTQEEQHKTSVKPQYMREGATTEGRYHRMEETLPHKKM